MATDAMVRTRSEQAGIVLISCLLSLLVMAVITSVYMMQARGQLAEARGLQQKIKQCSVAQSHFDQVVFTLLTRRRDELSGVLASTVSGAESDKGFWNYYAKPFEFFGSEVQLQDQAGLISAQDLLFPNGEQFMRGLGIPDDQIRLFQASLRDWQDKDDLYRLDGAERDWYAQQGRPTPRNGTIGSVNELRLIRGFPERLNPYIERGWLTLRPQGFFNPLTAPEPILAGFLNNSGLSAELDAARQLRPLAATELRNRTGLFESESLLMVPSRVLSVRVVAGDAYARCSKAFIVNLNGDTTLPYTLEATY